VQRTSRVVEGVVGVVVALVLVGGALLLWQMLRPDEIPGPVSGETEIPGGLTPGQMTIPGQSLIAGRASEAVVITFADYKANRQAYEPLIAQFHDLHPTIEVQFVPLEDTSGGERLSLLDIASAADAMLLRSVPQGTDATYFLDLTPLIEADPTFDGSDFWPGSLVGCQVGEHTLGLPVEVSLNLVFFDGTAFDAAGLSRPVPGWTWDDFQMAARELTRWEGDQVARYGFVPRGSPTTLLGPLVDAALTDAGGAWDSTALTRALDWYVTLANEGSLPAVGEEEEVWEQNQDLIDSGEAAMWVDTLMNLPWRRSSLGPEIEVAPFPVSANGSSPHTTPVIPSCVAMSAGTDHPQEAWAWLSFLTNHPIDEEPWYVPARPSIAETNGYWESVTEGTQAALRFALGHAWYGYASETLPVVDEALIKTLKGETDLATALELTGEVDLAQPTLPSGSASIVVATPRPTAAPESAVTVDYFVNTLAHTAPSGVEALAEEFNRTHPGIEVRPSTRLAGSGVFTLLDLAEQFDCFAWSGGVPPAAIEQLYSLDPLLATADISLADDFTPVLMDAFRIDDELYALPIATMPTVIYYNADHLAKLGLEPPSPNWTADDFVALAAAATSGEGKDKVYGFVPFQGDANGFLLAMQDVRLYDLHAEPPVVHFDDPEVVNAVAWMVSLADAGIMPAYDDGGTHSLMGDHHQREKLIVSGGAALWTDLADLRGGFTVDEEAGFHIGVAPLPLIPGPLLEPPFTNSVYISRRATDPVACWQWFIFLSDHPEVFRGVPARRSVTESEAWETAVGIDKARAYRAGLSRLALDHPSGDQYNYPSGPIDRWWQDALAASFQGVDVVVALTEAQQKSDAYLACLALEGSEEQSLACAEKADSEFKTFEELLKERSP